MEQDNNNITEKVIKESDIIKEEKENENKFNFKYFYENKKLTVIEYIVFTILSLGVTIFLTIKLGIEVYTFVRDEKGFEGEYKLNGISEDTFFGGYRDTTEFVWRSFRNNLLIILIFAAIMVTINQLIKRFFKIEIVKIFYLLFGLGYTCYLHRISIIYIFLVMVFEYILCLCYRYLGRIIFIILTWLICILTKAGLEYNIIVVPKFLDFLPEVVRNDFVNIGVSFQFIMLKVISFNMEYSIMCENDSSKTEKLNAEKEEHFQKCQVCQEGYFCLTTLKKYIIIEKSDFSFVNLIIYTFYPPFY